MTAAQAYYEFLRDKLCHQDGVAIGKMMSSQAVKCKGKVFVFFHQEKMTFKLGNNRLHVSMLLTGIIFSINNNLSFARVLKILL